MDVWILFEMSCGNWKANNQGWLWSQSWRISACLSCMNSKKKNSLLQLNYILQLKINISEFEYCV